MRTSYGGRDTFGRIHSLFPLDNDLVIADQLMDPHLAVVDRQSGRVIHRFGSDGEGPGEFRDVSSLFRVSADPTVLGAFDVPNQRLTFVRFSGPNSEPTLLRDVPFRAGNLVTGIAPFGVRYVATGGFGARYRLSAHDSLGRPVSRIRTATPDLVTDRIRKAALDRELLQNQLARRPDGDRLVLAFVELNRLEIIDLSDGTFRVVNGPRPTKPRFTTENPRPLDFDSETHERAYFGVAATRDRIYAAFCGCVHPRSAARRGEVPLPREVQVYDWDGTYLGSFAVDRQIWKIAVAPGDSLLFASYRTPVPLVGEWPIPEWVRP